MAEITYVPGGSPKIRNSPRSFVVAGLLLRVSTDGVPLVRAAIAVTGMPSTGAPESSRRIPAITAPRQALTTRPVTVSPSLIEIAVPGRPGRFAPYTDVMNAARVTVSVTRPAGRSAIVNRPSSSVMAPRLGRRSDPVRVTIARRTGLGCSSSLTT